MSERLRSGAKGLSLTQGVVRYQFPRPDDDQMLGSSALVQRFCNLAVGFESPFRFRFNSDEHSFEIVWAAALADDDESLGLFFIGEWSVHVRSLRARAARGGCTNEDANTPQIA